MNERTHNAPTHQKQAKAADKCRSAIKRLQADVTCPRCNTARVDYNGLLQLTCPQCGVIETGTFT